VDYLNDFLKYDRFGKEVVKNFLRSCDHSV